MEKLNFHLLRFFTDHYKPGVIGIVGTKGTISIAIREAQKGIGVSVGFPDLEAHETRDHGGEASLGRV